MPFRVEKISLRLFGLHRDRNSRRWEDSSGEIANERTELTVFGCCIFPLQELCSTRRFGCLRVQSFLNDPLLYAIAIRKKLDCESVAWFSSRFLEPRQERSQSRQNHSRFGYALPRISA